MKKQGGQDIVEFALMVPLFFVCNSWYNNATKQ